MANPQKPENENLASTGGVPSPPLPKIPSPEIPNIKNPADKSKPVKKKTSSTDSFQLADSQTEAQTKKNTTPTSHTPSDNPQQNTAKKTESSTTSSPPKPHKVAPQLATRAPAGKPAPVPIETPKLQQALENRPLSIEEKEKLDNTSPVTGWQKFLEFLQPIALGLLRVSILFAAGSLAFLILHFFHGNLSPNSPLANSGEFLHSISLASLTLEVSVVVLACCLIWYGSTQPPWLFPFSSLG